MVTPGPCTDLVCSLQCLACFQVGCCINNACMCLPGNCPSPTGAGGAGGMSGAGGSTNVGGAGGAAGSGGTGG